MMLSSGSPARVVVAEGIEIKVPAVTAIPLGFIANELITNAVKYGTGRITVSLEPNPEKGYTLSVSNDGPGLPEGFDPHPHRPHRTRGLTRWLYCWCLLDGDFYGPIVHGVFSECPLFFSTSLTRKRHCATSDPSMLSGLPGRPITRQISCKVAFPWRGSARTCPLRHALSYRHPASPSWSCPWPILAAIQSRKIS